MKKQRISGKEKVRYYTEQKLMKQVSILNSEEKDELNKQLDEIDKLSSEEAVAATIALTTWLQQKWDKYNEPICVNCARRSICKRQQVVKKCKFFEDGEQNES